MLGDCGNNYCGQNDLEPNVEYFDTFTLIPVNSPLSKIEADAYGLSLYINNTITRSGINNGQFCSARISGALAYVGNGTQFLQFSSDMAYLIYQGTMYLCYDYQKIPYQKSVKGLVVDNEGYVQTIQNSTYAISPKPMRHKVTSRAYLQASRRDTFIVCPKCVYPEEEESEEEGDGENDGENNSMPTWEIVLISVVSVVGAGFVGVLIWYLLKNKSERKRVRLDSE